ncbi:hypothetical protein Gorai_016407, partial [Gossypium raimondii]|nr:hypothetical protein [Gossypium raimondii]
VSHLKNQSFKASVNGERSWIYLNSDGAVKIDSGFATTGGVIVSGGWIMGFNRSLELCSVFNTELWGVHDGLTILQSHNYKGVVIRLDSQENLQAT